MKALIILSIIASFILLIQRIIMARKALKNYLAELYRYNCGKGFFNAWKYWQHKYYDNLTLCFVFIAGIVFLIFNLTWKPH